MKDLDAVLKVLDDQGIRLADLLREGRNATPVQGLSDTLLALMDEDGKTRLKPVFLRRIASGIMVYMDKAATRGAAR